VRTHLGFRSFGFWFAAFTVISAFVFISQRWVYPQDHRLTAQAVIDSTEQQFDAVQDYMVIVHVTVRMPGFRMPKKRMDLAFKQPDKIKVETEGFAVVPRAGLVASPEEIFGQLAGVQVTGDSMINDSVHYILEGRLSRDSDLFAGGPRRRRESPPSRIRLWVNPHPWLLTRLDAYADTSRLASLRITYTRVEDNIWLPETTRALFRLPAGGQNSGSGAPEPGAGPGFEGEFESALPDTGGQGSVTLTFSHYRVNTGLSNQFFQTKK